MVVKRANESTRSTFLQSSWNARGILSPYTYAHINFKFRLRAQLYTTQKSYISGPENFWQITLGKNGFFALFQIGYLNYQIKHIEELIEEQKFENQTWLWINF